MRVTTKSSPESAYFLTFSELFQLELDLIAKAYNALEPLQIYHAIELIINSSGKVIFSGVGKSGIIARKIASTLTSIKVPSIFLHPGEALHGDLGIVKPEDIIFVVSNSGETPELLTFLPYVRQRQVPIIALVGNPFSSIVRFADVVLHAMVEKEACPLNLAPTSSTTVALVVGDALAMTIMRIKGLTAEEFAINHPAGRLGKRLTLRVSDLMHRNSDNPTVSMKTSWLEAVSFITKGGMGAVNVVDETGHLIGLVTDGDIRRSIEKFEASKLVNLLVDQIMTPNPVTVHPDQLAYHVLQIMENRQSQISVVPVVDQENYCLGLLRLHDIAKSGLI